MAKSENGWKNIKPESNTSSSYKAKKKSRYFGLKSGPVLSPERKLERQKTEEHLESFLQRRLTPEQIVAKGILQDPEKETTKQKVRDRLNRFLDRGSSPPVFGGLISSNITYKGETAAIPFVVNNCITYLSASDRIESAGLFRISGSNDKINYWKHKFDQKMNVNISSEKDEHTIACLLKSYLRELQEPLIPDSFVEKYLLPIEIQKVTSVTYLNALVSFIPKLKLDCLKFLMKFLNKVAAKSTINQMTVQNLGLIFAPCLISGAPITEIPKLSQIIAATIQNQESIFVEKNEDNTK